MLQPLGQRPVLVEEAYRAILDEISEGRLRPGQRVRQEELAGLLQVSRQPVSHALALLKQEGFLVDSGRRGLEVAPLDPGYLLASYQVRSALDRTAARLAALRVLTQGDEAEVADGVAALKSAMARGRAAESQGSIASLVQADMAFHQAINRLSGNPVLVETAERQWGHLRRGMCAVLDSDYEIGRIWDEHAAILAAIESGEAELAAARAAAHADEAGQTTHRRLIGRTFEDKGAAGSAQET